MQNTDFDSRSALRWQAGQLVHIQAVQRSAVSVRVKRGIFSILHPAALDRGPSHTDYLMAPAQSGQTRQYQIRIEEDLIPCNITHIIPASSCEIFYFQNSFYHLSRNLVHVRVEKSPTRRDQYRYSYFPSPFILLSQRVKVKR